MNTLRFGSKNIMTLYNRIECHSNNKIIYVEHLLVFLQSIFAYFVASQSPRYFPPFDIDNTNHMIATNTTRKPFSLCALNKLRPGPG